MGTQNHSEVAGVAREDPDRTLGYRGRPPILLFGAVGLSVVAILRDETTLAIVMAVLAAALGIWIFLWHGGGIFSAAGLYSLTSAVMVGVGGIWWTTVEEQQPDYLALSVTVGFFSNLSMYALFWSRSPQYLATPTVEKATAAWLLAVGFVAAPVGVGFALSGVQLGSIVALGGLSLLLLGLSWTTRRLPTLARVALVSLPVAIFALVIFDGYGRLQIAGLALFGLATFQTRRGRYLKVLLLLVLPYAVIQFAEMREQFGADQFGSELNGIGSVVNPVVSFSRLVTAHEFGKFEFGEGNPLLASLLFWVPREAWPGKPLGFGSQLSTILDPELAAIGHSESALAYGEWYYLFGPIGLVAMVFVIGYLVRLLDRVWFRCHSRTLSSRTDVLRYVLLAYMVSGIVYYFWSSSHTFSTRVVPQVSFALVMFATTGFLLWDRRLGSHRA